MVIGGIFHAKRTEDQVEIARQSVLHRFKTARAGHFDFSRIAGLYANVLNNLARPAALFKKVGAAGDVERAILFDFWAIVHAFRQDIEIKFEWFPFKFEQGDEHGRPLCGRMVLFQYIGLSCLHSPEAKRRIAAIPEAPASMHSPAFCPVTPPRAKTGMEAAARQACASIFRPCPGIRSSAVCFSNTGANNASVAPASRARSISMVLWQEMLITGGLPVPAHVLRTCSRAFAANPEGRCTPSHWHDKAIPAGPFSRTRVWPPAWRTTHTISRVREASSSGARSFSRTWM